MQQYKKLRNQVSCKISKETIEFNNKRIDKTKSEKEVWNVINDVTNLKSNESWCLKTEKGETSGKNIIAETFNNFFKTKIDLLKNNIDDNLKEDPLAKINAFTLLAIKATSFLQISQFVY